ncbi:hypothetical protein I316_07052 [Kwoniella heveanensis BCC8398]|uniref:Uncharacterized protein n=1 Tax=Kwoniella heveanensis BCC8398 TaxID=1296120 RepID=A0A1B9GJU6_9TREE|nr:hypothetical protein I316_07052 [Kwoniella heveanensis BCC8398]
MTFHPPPHPHPHSQLQEPINPHTFQQQQGQWTNIYPPTHPPSIPSQHFHLKEQSIQTPDTSFESLQEGEEVDPILRNFPPASRRRRNVAQPTSMPTSSCTIRKAAKSKGKGKLATSKSNSSSSAAVPRRVDTHTQAPIVHRPEPAHATEQMTAIFLPDPYQPPIQLKGLNKSGLLPAPPGSILDVNDLLILHPPARETHGLGHTSQYEMYTCRVCSKTYDGKNARSVARRHLQDKHGVPLAVQKRRSRWDYAYNCTEPDRPKTKKDAKERSLKSKRDWANRNRQIQKLERAQAPFLERFGPEGVITPCGMRLIAPKFKGPIAHSAKPGSYLDGIGGNLIIPEDILREVQIIRDIDISGSHPRSPGEEALEEEELLLEETPITATGKAKWKGKKQAQNKSSSRTTSQEDTSTRSITPLIAISDERPSLDGHDSQLLPSIPAQANAFRHGVYFQQYIPQIYGWQVDGSFQPATTQIINGQHPLGYATVYGPASHGQQLIQEQYDQQDDYHDIRQRVQSFEINKEEEEGEMVYDKRFPIDPSLQEDQESSILPSSPEDIGHLPEQQWVPSQSWETAQRDSQAILEPALDLSQRWHGLLLTSTGWGSSDGGSDIVTDQNAQQERVKEGSVGTEGEAVAAESLLNLHSTPLRGPEERGRNEIQLANAQADIVSTTRSESKSALGLRFGQELSSSTSSSTTTAMTAKDPVTKATDHEGSEPTSGSVLTKGHSDKLLAAPPITSPARLTTLTRAGRAYSFIQPFRDPRPEVTRSLSFDHQPIFGQLDDDDPFTLPDTPVHAMTSSSTRPSSAGGTGSSSSDRIARTPASSATRRSKRHTIALPSPSPFASSRHFSLSSSSASVLKKRKDAPTSPFANPAPNSKSGPNTSDRSQLRSALKPISTNVKPNYSGAFATPIKSAAFGSASTQAIPQSLTREWLQLSSPCNADAAASLGLVPTHLAPATPGLRGVIGAETPEMTILEARAKKRRGEATPGTSVGVALGTGYRR